AAARVRAVGPHSPHPPTPPARAPPSPAVRERGFGTVTKPVSTSAAQAWGLRLFGSPQPPPPPDSSMSRSPGRITRPVSLVLIGRGGLLPEWSMYLCGQPSAPPRMPQAPCLTPSPAVLPTAGSAVSTTISPTPPGPPRY